VIHASNIREALVRIRPHIRRTPIIEAREYPECEVILKLENFQVTGSFKARGALNKLCALGEAGRRPGIITASSGNHGAAVAYGSQALGCQASVYVPEGADPSKVAAIQSYGATVHTHGSDCALTEAFARHRARELGKTYISPYNDREVITGQGTVAFELAEQAGALDAVFVSVGGGGLIAGIGSYFKGLNAETEIIACSPERSPAMHACLKAGAIIEVPCFPTLSDATAGGVEPGSVSFELCREVIDTSVLVSEDAIRHGTRQLIETHHMLAEGAAGVALAAFLERRHAYQGKRVAIIVCGANIGIDKLRDVLG
jgi:threonine dehydratase